MAGCLCSLVLTVLVASVLTFSIGSVDSIFFYLPFAYNSVHVVLYLCSSSG